MLLDTKRWTMPAVVPFEGETIEALKHAIRRIETEGWSPDNGDCPCTQIAITSYWPSHNDFLLGRCDEAFGYLRAVIGRYDIIEWTEAPGRTVDEVLAALRRAIELARADA